MSSETGSPIDMDVVGKDEDSQKDPEQPQEEFSKLAVLSRLIKYSKCEFYFACVSALFNGICFSGFAFGFKYAIEWLSDVQYDTGNSEMPEAGINIALLFG